MPRADVRRADVRALAARAEAEGWDTWTLVAAVAEECGCSRLLAQRLARDWLLEDVRSHLAALGCRVMVQQVSAWETGRTRPSDPTLDYLCRLYETRPDRLGFGHDYTPGGDIAEPHHEAVAAPAETEPSAVLGIIGTGPLAAPVLAALARIRAGMTEILGPAVSEMTIEQWERGAEEYGHEYQVRPPAVLLSASVRDFADIQSVLQQRQPADVRARLCRIAAHFAATAGIALVALGEHREARRWYHVAQLAADETGDRALRAWLLCREAVIPFYFGAPAAAATLAERARVLAGSTVCSTAAWAPALEARALARMGRHRDAQNALRLAHQAFSRLTAADTADTADTAYGYTERQLAWHEGSMWTTVGDTRRAQPALQHARTLYAPTEHLDRALIAMDEVTGLLGVGEVSVACQEAERLLLGLPPEHLTGIIINRVRDVLAAVPSRAAGTPSVRSLRDLVQESSRPAITAG